MKFKTWLLDELANGVSTYDIKAPSGDRRPDLKTGGEVPEEQERKRDEPKSPMQPDPVTSAFQTYSLPRMKKMKNRK